MHVFCVVEKQRKRCDCTLTERIIKVSQVERLLFSKIYFSVRDDKHVIAQVLARFGKILAIRACLVSPWGISPKASPKYKPWLDQSHPDVFPNRTKRCAITCFNPIPPGGGGGMPAPISTFKNFLDI